MALTGHLSDLSLSELIEFFCNQRKSGRLKVLYPKGAGYFYLQAGSVVDARVGVLHGIEAVYYALTLPNAEFEFSADAEAVERTINQPWTQVVLEGLRRLDEGIAPEVAFPEGYVPEPDELQVAANDERMTQEVHRSYTPAFLNFGKEAVGRRKPLFIGAIAVAVVASVAVIGVPAGWYHSKATAAVGTTPTPAPAPVEPQPESSATAQPAVTETDRSEDAAAIAARRQRERDRAKREAARSQNAAAGLTPAQVVNEPAKPGSKRVTVTVSYDESGRVTQASGGDATAVRIARQKRFPPGKAGSATITIPIN
jgi:Domain of unknown function (DUF4388)